MNITEAREQVIEMGHTLLRSGLLVRTWGNISCRVNDHQFVITPSGRDYTTLKRDEIVLVNIINEKSWGKVIPSVEKGVHLDVYKLRPEVNAVIHTHQTKASVLSAMDMGLPARYDHQFQGSVRCADYAFPGSAELRSNVKEELLNGTGNAILMSHHGALCMGGSLSDAFRCGFVLERSAEHYIREACQRIFGTEWSGNLFVYAKLFEARQKSFPQEIFMLGSASIEKGECVLQKDAALSDQIKLKEDSELSKTIFQKIFEKRPDIRYIRQIYTPEILTYSVLGDNLHTYIDDFAQINGEVMVSSSLDPDEIVEALGSNHGVLLQGYGALCCGNTIDDIDALAIVAEKNAHAWLVSTFFEGHDIVAVPEKECAMMRDFYLQNYSKRFHRKSK